MALLLRNDATFLHVPKTAGMWIAAVLGDLGLVRCRIASKHADMERVLHCARHHPGRYLEAVAKAGPAWQRRVRTGFKFCFVRHPLAWYESYWLFMRSRRWNAWGINRRGRRRWHPNAVLDGLGDGDFNRFVRNVLERRPGYVSEMYGWYATADIDFVGRQERLTDDLIEALRRMSLVFDEEQVRRRAPVNVSDGSDVRPSWDVSVRREVLRAERTAIERFAYDPADTNLA